MDISDLTYTLFMVICALIALHISSGGGGGKRSRVPIARS